MCPSTLEEVTADVRPAIFAQRDPVLLQPTFTASTFQIFEALVAGFIGRVGEHTVTGMWQAARLAGRLHHSRAHDFFARAAWRPDRLGLLLLDSSSSASWASIALRLPSSLGRP
jgi:hypothetical protein